MSDKMVSEVVEVKCGLVYKDGSYTVALSIGNLSDEQFAGFVGEYLHQAAVMVLADAAEEFEGSVRRITHPESTIRQ